MEEKDPALSPTFLFVCTTTFNCSTLGLWEKEDGTNDASAIHPSMHHQIQGLEIAKELSSHYSYENKMRR